KVGRSSLAESGLLARAWWLPDQLSTWAAWQARHASGSAVSDGRGPDAMGKSSAAIDGRGEVNGVSPLSGAAPGALSSHPLIKSAIKSRGGASSPGRVIERFMDRAAGRKRNSWWGPSA